MNTGRQRGHIGKVLKVNRKHNTVTVQGVNLKYIKVEDEEMQRRQKVAQKEYPVHVSNVNLVDPESQKPTRISWGYLEDGTKVRVSKRSGQIIPKPDRSELKFINRIKDKKMGEHDTDPELVLEKTYTGEDFLSVYNEFNEYIRMKEEREELLVFKE